MAKRVPAQVLVHCFNCKRLVWRESTREYSVLNPISEVAIAESFCPPCCDEIEARSRNVTSYNSGESQQVL